MRQMERASRAGCASPRPRLRAALGLSAFHVEDGRGGVAGHRPGHAYAPGTGTNATAATSAAAKAYAQRSERLSDAWKQAK